MTAAAFVMLIVAGFASGLVGYVTGLASIVSYPALLLAGLNPLQANVTNTVALVPVGIGSTAQSGKALLTDKRSLIRLGVLSALGGAIGAVIVLNSPEKSFETVVPYLVVLASLAVLAQPVLRRLAGHREMPRGFEAGIFVVSIYGGYFGAGAGVIFLALSLVLTANPLWRASLLKSALLGISNLVAAVIFSVTGPVHWTAALAMGIGCLAGGWFGPPIVRRLPPTPLRIVIGVAGLGLAVWLAIR